MRDYSINPILNTVRQRLWRLNKNWIAAFIGDPGSGKSFASLEVADYIEKGKFSIDRVFFKVRDLLKAVDDGEIKKGMAVILDEAGIAWKARAFMRQENQDMSDLFQVMRFMNFALIMTVPSLAFIDKHGRGLCKMVFRTKTINHEKRISTCEVFYITSNPLTGKVYPKWPRIMINGVRHKAAMMNIAHPRDELADEYEIRKKAYGREVVHEQRMKAEARDAKEAEQAEQEPKKPYSCKKCGYEGKTTRPKPRCGRCNSSIVVVDG